MGVAVKGPACLASGERQWIVLYRTESAIAITENTAITAPQDTFVVPGGLLGPNSIIRGSLFITDAAGGNVTTRQNIGGVTDGDTFSLRACNSGNSLYQIAYVWNQNSLTSQMATAENYVINTGNTNNVNTFSVDTTQSFNITLHGVTGAGVTGTFQWWQIEVLI